MPQSLSYVHSVHLALTRRCGAQCNYCTFKQSDSPLMTFDEIEQVIRKQKPTGISTVVLGAGQSLERLANLPALWNDQGYASFIHYVQDVCRIVLEHQLLPVVDIGPLTYAQLEMLRPFVPTIHLALENINTDFRATVQQNKSADDIMETFSDAGILGIPITTGLLFGAGESIDDGLATLNALDEIQKRYHNLQSVTLQYVYDTKRGNATRTDIEYLDMLVKYSRKVMPDVAVIVPIHAQLHWLDEGLLPDDIGFVFEGFDGINYDAPFPKLTELERQFAKNHITLVPRLPVFPDFIDRIDASESLRSVLADWQSKRMYVTYAKA
ncbi:MAG TPA: radical SAM protein [bacterium]|nr:radical SAM protein [bacterium]HNH28202.1 radical SAM protein [bacterium]HNH33765.1 radical SAM protein [bacterium]HNI10935.1 radical SAM protein [bacterium]HNJ70965.1 radical SAM protein [bacterium]